ncbi:MAG TPA: exosome complex protein Rrp42 [Candidatus Nanoarchaeia archaeon]|nr:exosome complex protein Rrp42 [Candidatus Nanoarchaeia archaeon]
MTTPNLNAERIKKSLEKGKRFDGRKLEEFRDITIEYDVSKKAEGSVKVKIGNTEVVVGIKMDVSAPYPDSLDKGNLIVSAELLPLSSQRFESGPPRIEAIELGRVIDRGIRESKFIKFDKLCIEPGEKVWTVFVDIYSINDDGNLLDAAGIGAVAALKAARIPKYDKEAGKVLYGELTKEKLPLEKDIPIVITSHKIGNKVIVDPTREEEDISETRLTIGSSNGNISSIQKGDSSALTIEETLNMIDLIEMVEREVFKKIEKFLK